VSAGVAVDRRATGSVASEPSMRLRSRAAPPRPEVAGYRRPRAYARGYTFQISFDVRGGCFKKGAKAARACDET